MKRIAQIIVILLTVLICVASLARAETMVWQTIQLSRAEKITVIYEYPENMQLGDEISFYCEFEGCCEEDFNYTWQYSYNKIWWTNFGSQPRLDTTYCNMLAGKYVKLEVERK